MVSARRRLRVESRQHGGDVLVRQAVEPVAPDARLVQLGRQRESLRDVGIGPVEGGVEAGDLRQIRHPLQQQGDRRQVVGLMQGGERDEAAPGP